MPVTIVTANLITYIDGKNKKNHNIFDIFYQTDQDNKISNDSAEYKAPLKTTTTVRFSRQSYKTVKKCNKKFK